MARDRLRREIESLLRGEWRHALDLADLREAVLGSRSIAVPAGRAAGGPVVPAVGWLCLPTAADALYGYNADWLPLAEPPCESSPVRLVLGDVATVYENRSRGWPSRVAGAGRLSWGKRITPRLDPQDGCLAGYREDLWYEGVRLHPLDGLPDGSQPEYWVEDAVEMELDGVPYWRWVVRQSRATEVSSLTVYTLRKGQSADTAQVITVTGLLVSSVAVRVCQCALSDDGRHVAALAAEDPYLKQTHVFVADVGDFVTGSIAATKQVSWAVTDVSFSYNRVYAWREIAYDAYERTITTASTAKVTRPFRVTWDAAGLVVWSTELHGAYDKSEYAINIYRGTRVHWQQFSEDVWLGWTYTANRTDKTSSLVLKVKKNGIQVGEDVALYESDYHVVDDQSPLGTGAPNWVFFPDSDVSDPRQVPDGSFWIDGACGNEACPGNDWCSRCVPDEWKVWTKTDQWTYRPSLALAEAVGSSGVGLVQLNQKSYRVEEDYDAQTRSDTETSDFSTRFLALGVDGFAPQVCGRGWGWGGDIFAPTSESSAEGQIVAVDTFSFDDPLFSGRLLELSDGRVVFSGRTSWVPGTLPNGQSTEPGGFIWASDGGVVAWAPAGSSSAGAGFGDLGEV